ncbi:ATP-dependent DNA helicase [uncultured virus]|nr:ATP-dependent DNA helicase [uncultured virus]
MATAPSAYGVGPSQVYEVLGWCMRVITPARGDEPAVFQLKTQDNREFRVTCTFFCPLEEGDSVYGYVQMFGEGELNFVHQPFIQIPVAEESIKVCFIRALHGSGFGQISAQDLYNRLTELARIANFAKQRMEQRKRAAQAVLVIPGIPMVVDPVAAEKEKEKEETAKMVAGPDGVIAYLSDLAAQYTKSPNPALVEGLVAGTKLKPAQIEALLRWWHQHRSLRRLHLLGLTNKEIRACMKPLDEIYEICMLNPYRLPSIPLEKAEKIMISMRKQPSATEISCGKIVRKMYEKQETHGWTGTPVFILAKEFSNFHSLRELLVSDYEVYLDYNMAYLKYAYTVETYMAEYIDTRIKSTARNFLKQRPAEASGQYSGEKAQQAQKAAAELDAAFHADAALAGVAGLPLPVEGEAVPAAEAPKEKPVPAEAPKKEPIEFVELPKLDTIHLESAMYGCKTLTGEQKLSIQGALAHDLCIINGGAGVGKSTVIAEIVRNLQIRDIPFAAVAFTGKAVARLQEVLKCRLAATMDRMITRANQMPEFHHLIIDEISMVTMELMYRFVKAFPGRYKITLVGDVNQLQPIGWGCLMRQLIATKRVPTYTLTVNQRIVKHVVDKVETDKPAGLMAPGEASFDRVMLENANALIDPKRDLGEPIQFRDGAGFYQMEGGAETIQTIVQQLHRAGIPESEILLICPYNEYLDNLNLIMQTTYLEKNKKMVDQNKKLWCVGDRVMMLSNNYDINVMNGENGYVIDLTDEGVIVQFKDGAEHLFRYQSKNPQPWKHRGEAWKKAKDEDGGNGDGDDNELTIAELRHSFAVSVHKAQGNEQTFVGGLIPARRGKDGKLTSSFLNINLLYVMITRARRAMWLVGSEMVIGLATCKASPRRFENLCARLIGMRDKELEVHIDTLTGNGAIKVDEEAPAEDEGQHEDFGSYE